MSTVLLHINPRTLNVDSGKWNSDNSLGQLVQELADYYSELGDRLEITSIPDIWAKPKLFEAQLRDGSPASSVREWRAILAIIGLCAIKGIDLEIKSINIPRFNSPEYNASTVRFLKVVSRMMDKELSDYAKGNVVNVITYSGKPIALVWPNSIVYPIAGVDIKNTWCNGGNYKDPTENGVLTQDERLVLAKWLYNLKETVIQYKRANIVAQNDEKKNQKFDKIVERVEEFIRELGYENITLLGDNNINSLFDNFAIQFRLTSNFNIPGYGGSLLNQVYSPSRDVPPECVSHIRLDSLDKERHVLVISEAIAKQWNLPKHLIRCYNYNGLDKALAIIRDINQKNKFIKDNNLTSIKTELWTENDFFTDKIVVITGFINMQTTPLPNSLTEMDDSIKSKFFKQFNKRNLQEFVLPIKQDVLKFISKKDLLEKIDIKRDSSNSNIIVSLTITLSGYDNARKDVTLTKVYKADANNKEGDITTIIRNSLPNVQIWPNFSDANWKKYYVFTGRNTASKVTIAPVWDDGIKEDFNFNIKTRKDFSVKLRSGSAFPMVFVFRTVEWEPKELGLICLDDKKIDQINKPRGECYIGVDFGTTNTVVSYAPKVPGNNVWKQMTFKDRIFSVTRAGDFEKADLRRYFFPAGSQPEIISGATTNSIRTIFHEFQRSKDNDNEPEVINDVEQALVRGNIYYLERNKSISEDKGLFQDLKSEIKWRHEKTMRAFLYQLCLQAMAEVFAEGFTKITWQYSWPTAFDKERKTFYKSFWTVDLINSMNHISIMSDSKNVREKTESESMSDYFQNVIGNGGGGLRYVNGLLTIDIGGGTTDISVWDGSGLVGQCSFRMAGSDIFSNYIANKYKHYGELLTPLSGDDSNLSAKLTKLNSLASDAVKSNNETDWQTFKLELESILKYTESDLLRNIRSASNNDEQLNIVMRDIAFALGGIFYYAGAIIAYLRNKGQKDDGTMISENSPIYTGLPDCFVGGNGSKLLNWAARGDFDTLIELCRFFLVAGVQDNSTVFDEDRFQSDRFIKKSNQPKIEVSLGLISSEGRKISKDKKGEILGGGSTKSITDIIKRAKEFGKQSAGGSVVSAISEGGYAVVSGEQFSVSGLSDYANDGKIREEHFTNKSRIIINCENNRFLNYLIYFNYLIISKSLFGGHQIDFTDGQGFDERRLVNMIGNELAKKAEEAKNGKGITIEPIFIMELREAINKLSNF